MPTHAQVRMDVHMYVNMYASKCLHMHIAKRLVLFNSNK